MLFIPWKKSDSSDFNEKSQWNQKEKLEKTISSLTLLQINKNVHKTRINRYRIILHEWIFRMLHTISLRRKQFSCVYHIFITKKNPNRILSISLYENIFHFHLLSSESIFFRFHIFTERKVTKLIPHFWGKHTTQSRLQSQSQHSHRIFISWK